LIDEGDEVKKNYAGIEEKGGGDGLMVASVNDAGRGEKLRLCLTGLKNRESEKQRERGKRIKNEPSRFRSMSNCWELSGNPEKNKGKGKNTSNAPSPKRENKYRRGRVG